MSDIASIIVRYEIKDEELETTYKSLICNHYRGFDPVGLISRSAIGVKYMLENRKKIKYLGDGIGEGNISYQTLRRFFDVDFEKETLFVSTDAVSEAKELFDEGKINKEDLADTVLWRDTDYGQLLIDITGNLGCEVIKYAFIDNIYNPISYTVQEYMEKYNITLKDIGAVARTSYYEDSRFVYMSKDEVSSYISMDIYEYIYYNEGLVERQRIELSQSDLIDGLELSARSYNCLMRAGIRTVSELKALEANQIKTIRNLNEKCFLEIMEKLQ